MAGSEHAHALRPLEPGAVVEAVVEDDRVPRLALEDIGGQCAPVAQRRPRLA